MASMRTTLLSSYEASTGAECRRYAVSIRWSRQQMSRDRAMRWICRQVGVWREGVR